MNLRIVFVAAAALALAACQSAPSLPSLSATPAPTASGMVAKMQAVGTADLNDAEVDAVAHSDAISTPCYPALVTWLNGVQSPVVTPPAGAGVFWAQQRLRDVAAAGSSVSIPVSVKLACAALFVDDATFIAKADACLAAAVATGGASVPAGLGLVAPLPLAISPTGVTVTAPLP